ncbi:hypothetical protein KOY48_00040 [Candidatus Minimicrobia naudis]|uniref:Uncharacterized protein n=1 Tax=Candidatus Minimicrobia naudis TaxID=2841263 RepID=A0A8F1MCD7_9BACT|nr:hypothetical protein KOY48_00040 [Candidatus Minimicrobia naudis]
MYSDKYCGYAKDFSMGSGSSEDPAINLVGLLCSGITNSPGKHVSRGGYSNC